MKIDTKSPEFVNLCAAVRACWQSIGNDSLAGYAECGMRMPGNAACVETCLDANRLATYPGGDEGHQADAYVISVCKSGGYTALHRAVCRAVKLN